jgi:tripartite-type tricarboxylate transporter receptor subunit TctC
MQQSVSLSGAEARGQDFPVSGTLGGVFRVQDRPMKSSTYAFVLTALCGMALQATAQTYPDRPVRFVVSFPPGGSTDFIARILARHLPAALGQTIVVDNRGGGGGNIGNDIVAKAVPDGYTLLITAEGTITLNPSVYSKLPYNAMRDLPAITQLIKYPNVVVLHPSVPASNVQELIKVAKAQPGKLRYAHPGVGTGQQLAVELFKMMVGVDIISVPYKGGGPAMVGLASNETQLSFATPPSSLPHVKAGRLKAIAQTSAKRSAALPDLPTVAESGVAGFDVDGWVGMFAPDKAPQRAIERMYAETVKVLQMPEVRDLVLAAGSETSGISTTETRDKVARETAMWAKVVKSTGIKVE